IKEVDTRELLDQFLALATDDADIGDFAHRFGPLRLCELHQAVSCHRPLKLMMCGVRLVHGADEMEYDEDLILCLPKVEGITRAGYFIYSEPTLAWRRLAREALALVEAAAALAGNGAVDGATWAQLDDGVDLDDPANPAGFRSYISNPSNRLGEQLNRWIQIT